jgi:RpiB/LacA/LacB family sugar-phosphate isomerase
LQLVIASDHGGYELKEWLREMLAELDHSVEDLGPYNSDSVDYPDYAARVAGRVASGGAERGVLVCGSGIGMSIAANKVPGVRAAVVQDVAHALLAAEHNNANILCLGARFTAPPLAAEIVQAWLAQDCTGPRHHRRIQKITELEGE